MNPEHQYFQPAGNGHPQPAPHQYSQSAHPGHSHVPMGYPMHPAQHEQHQPVAPLQPAKHMLPTPVVKVLSPFGVTYVFLTVALLIGAVSIISILLLLVNGANGFAALAFPTAALVVTLPIFAGLFLYLKKLELKHPELRFDASKRRSTQFVQILAFLTCVFTLIGFLSIVFTAIGGLGEVSVGKSALNALCLLAVAGGILAYYWHDEHTIKR